MFKRCLLFLCVVLALGLLTGATDQPKQLQAPASLKAQPVPDAMLRHVKLRESLTNSQKAAIAELLNKYLPELEAIRPIVDSQMPIISKLSNLPLPGEGQLMEEMVSLQRLAKAAPVMSAVLVKIDKGMERILTQEQWAAYRTSTPPLKGDVAAKVDQLGKTFVSQAEPKPFGWISVSASYGAVGVYYAWYANELAKSADLAWGGTDLDLGVQYTGIMYDYYAKYAFPYIGAGYFYLQQWGEDVPFSYVYRAYEYFYWSYTYGIYAYTFFSNFWTTHGNPTSIYYVFLYCYYAYVPLYNASYYASQAYHGL
jgi:hypothetical protein